MSAPDVLTPAQHRAMLARAVSRARRTGDPADQDAAEVVRSEYATQRLAEHIQLVVAKAPELSAEQIDRLTSLIRGAR